MPKVSVTIPTYISIVVCTYNRYESLKSTLDSLLAQDRVEGFDYEVIVVDNNSNDETKKTVESYFGKFNGKLKYVFESKQGKPFALNTGIQKTNSSIIAFTDDDIIVDKNWLNSIRDSFQNHNCDALVGRVFLNFHGEKPEWLSHRLMKSIGMIDFGDRSHVLSAKEALVGGNMALKKEVFRKFGLFDTSSFQEAGEDTELSQRIQRNGGLLYYSLDVIVYHQIYSARMTKKAFRKLYFRQGRSDYFMDVDKSPSVRLSLYYLKIILNDFIKCIFVQNEESKIWLECQICFKLGYLKGILSRFNDKKIAN